MTQHPIGTVTFLSADIEGSTKLAVPPLWRTDRADFGAERERLLGLGLSVETQEHSWVPWRSLYVPDPQRNVIELVYYDECLQEVD